MKKSCFDGFWTKFSEMLRRMAGKGIARSEGRLNPMLLAVIKIIIISFLLVFAFQDGFNTTL